MEIINADYEILTCINGVEVLKNIERAGRVCYRSESGTTDDSYRTFVKSLIERGHESVIEHYSFSVRFTCDRGVSHEIVRHRLASFSQESTRYVNPAAGGVEDITLKFIKPCYLDPYSTAFTEWAQAMWHAERAYINMVIAGCKPEEARAVLPNSYATSLIVTTNLREWRHFFRLRCAPSAHPSMREVTIPLLAELQRLIPVVFDDIT